MERKYKTLILSLIFFEILIYIFRIRYDILLDGISLWWIQILGFMGIVLVWTISRIHKIRNCDWEWWHKGIRIFFSVMCGLFLEFVIFGTGMLAHENEHVNVLYLSKGETQKQFIVKEYNTNFAATGFVYEKKGGFLLKKINNMRYDTERSFFPVNVSQYQAEYSEEMGILSLWYNETPTSTYKKQQEAENMDSEGKWDAVVSGVVGE